MPKNFQYNDVTDDIADVELRAELRVKDAIQAIDSDDKLTLITMLKDAHVADIAELITLLHGQYRSEFIRLVGDDLDPEVLPELDEGIQADVSEMLETDTLVAAVKDLETDDAVSVLEELDVEDQKEILEQIPEIDRVVLQRSLDYPEDSAGRLMRSDVVAIPPFWTIEQTINYLREKEDLPDDFTEIFIVDPQHIPIGTLYLNKVIRAHPMTILSDLLKNEQLNLIPATMDREDLAHLFKRYNLLSAPVIDENKMLLGVITADDVFEVISEEAEEDILRLGGVVSDEAVTDNTFQVARNRFSWLFINLLTAVLASVVIAFFDTSIEQIIALAVLMPVVASMAGNAGTQTLTITVRALATHEILPINALRIIMREGAIGLINGLLFSVLLGVIGWLWFDNATLGGVLVLAMIVSMFIAALAGILIPLGLDKLGIDPAIASAVFVTTVTDIVGFFSFLGLATLFMI